MLTLRNSLPWFLVLGPAAFASTLTEPIPTVTTTCTVNQSPVQCSNLNAPGATAYGQITGLNTANGVFVNLFAQVWTNGQIQQASALTSVDFLGSTDGPERAGYATYSIYTVGDHGGGAGLSATGTIENLGSAQLVGTEGITQQGTNVAFELGIPFEIQASVFAQSFDKFSGAGGVIQIALQLFELDGASVPISDPALPVPESKTWVLSAIGAAFVLTRRTVLA